MKHPNHIITSSYHLIITFFLLINPFLIFSQPLTSNLTPHTSHLIILHTNDTHSNIESYNEPGLGNVGGILRRYSYFQEVLKENPNTIIVDAGDFSQGTPYFNLYKGVPEIELMNMLGYDVVTLGNHEFDNGSKALAKRLKLAHFTIVNANYKFKNKTLNKIVKPYTVINMDGKKIGIFGLLCDMKRLIMPHYYKETTFLNPITTAQNIVEILKNKEQCDLIICLSHLGVVVEFEGDIIDPELAAQVSGIDFIIGGHTHKLIEEPLIINGTKIVQVWKNGVYTGKIMISD